MSDTAVVFYDRDGNEIGRQELGEVQGVTLSDLPAPEGAEFARVVMKAPPPEPGEVTIVQGILVRP